LYSIQGFEYSCKCAGLGRSEGHEHLNYKSLKCAEVSDGLSNLFSTWAYEAENICNEKSMSVFMLPLRMRRHIIYRFIVLYFPMFFLDMVHLQLDII